MAAQISQSDSFLIGLQGYFLGIRMKNLSPNLTFEWATLLSKLPMGRPCGQMDLVAEGPSGCSLISSHIP